MSKIIAVHGATGVQGGSVIKALLKSDWKVRAITRNTTSDSAKALVAAGAEVVTGNFDDEASLSKAYEGVEAIFLVTNFWEHLFTGKNAEESGKAESEQALAVVKIADKLPGLKHFIWSTLPGNAPGQPKRLAVPHCDYKALLDVTIKNSYPSLAAKTTFLYVGWYANNLVNFPSAKPFTTPFSYGAYFMLNPVPRTTILPSAGDASTNVGIVVKAVLEQRSKSLGKYVAVTVDNPTFEEVLGFWSKATGKQAAYLEVNGDDWNAAFGAPGKEMYLNYKLFEEGVVFEDNSPLSAKDLGIEGLVGTEEFLIGAKSALL